MTKVLVLYYPSVSHHRALAQAVAEGIRDAGGEPVVTRVPEPGPDELTRPVGVTPARTTAATIDELGNCDVVIVGRYRAPTSRAGLHEPSKAELDGARSRGRRVARIAVKAR